MSHVHSRVSVFGLGYVGTVTAACLARSGHWVVGVDTNPTKVEMIQQGSSPVVEPGLDELLASERRAGRIRATTNGQQALQDTTVSLICVGTPSRVNGSIDLSYLEAVCELIGQGLRDLGRFHLIVIRSTILPGTMTKVVIPLLETHSGLTCGRDFGVCNNPEFLREGSALDDFVHPPKTVIGESDARSGDLLASLYSEIDAPLFRQSLNVVEMTKYVDNAWHALKVGFGNEVGRMCKALNIDSHEVMDIFCQDVKLNISTTYLTPGPPFGGSCLPKDLRALTHKAHNLNVEVPILSAVLPSNEVHIMACVRAVMEAGHKKVGVLGLSFKPETDDLRESPIVELVERLLGKGYDIRIFDRNVSMARVVGANRDYILNRIPHVSQLLVDQIDEVIEHGDTILIGTFSDEHNAAVIPVLGDKSIVDLVRGIVSQTEDGYSGLCW